MEVILWKEDDWTTDKFMYIITIVTLVPHCSNTSLLALAGAREAAPAFNKGQEKCNVNRKIARRMFMSLRLSTHQQCQLERSLIA